MSLVVAGSMPECQIDVEDEIFEFIHPKTDCFRATCEHFSICSRYKSRRILSIPQSAQSEDVSDSSVYSPSVFYDLEIEKRSIEEIEFFRANWPLVGDGVAHAKCGTYWTKVCNKKHDPIELPEGIAHQKGLDGKCLHDGVAVLRVKMSCHRPICPTCWTDWRKRQIARAKHRFEASEKDYNRKEKRHVKRCHGVISIPKQLWYLSEEKMKILALKHLKTLGIDGGTIIYHPKRERKNKKGSWYFSPHFHVYFHAWNAWVDGEKVKKWSKKTGWVFNNFGERVLGKSLSYQLSHAGVPPNHGHVVTWFGSMNYRLLHVEKWHGDSAKCPWGHVFDHYGVYQGEKPLELPNEDGYQAYLPRDGWLILPNKSDYG